MRKLPAVLSVAIVVTSIGPQACACDEPGTPNHERATALSSSEIRLDWNNTASEADIYFDIEGSIDHSIANFGPFNAGRDKSVSFIVRGLGQPKSRHCFRIWARTGANGCRSELPSAWACAITPGPPSPLSSVSVTPPLAQGDTQLRVAWIRNPAGDESGFQVFEVGAQSPAATVSNGITSVIISGLRANEKHCYFVRAYNQWGRNDSAQACGQTIKPLVIKHLPLPH